MAKPVRKLDYIPEIMYDAPAYPGQKTSPIPYMIIPKDKDMPIGLFVLEYRKTGEIQIGDSGNPEEIEEGPFPHTYIEMDYLMEVLEEQFPDLDMELAAKQIRTGLGMKPTKKESAEAGEKILEKILAKEQMIEQNAKREQEERVAKIKTLMDAETSSDSSKESN